MTFVPIIPETVFHIFGWPITNTLINAFIALVIFLVVGLLLRRGSKERPTGLQNFCEMILEFLLNFFDQVTHDRVKSRRFLPIVGTLFLFILISNWMGLFPGVGSIGVWEIVHGEREFLPLLRSANSDLNLTLAMALFSVVASHVMGVVTLGFFTHTNKFIQLGGLWKGIKSLNIMTFFTALIEFGVGLIEIVSEIAKIASLSLRLFGNVFAGEVLMTVIAGLVGYIVPLPFMALELMVGVIQATVFSMLVLVYLTVMSMPPHGEHEEHHEKAIAHA